MAEECVPAWAESLRNDMVDLKERLGMCDDQEEESNHQSEVLYNNQKQQNFNRNKQNFNRYNQNFKPDFKIKVTCYVCENIGDAESVENMGIMRIVHGDFKVCGVSVDQWVEHSS